MTSQLLARDHVASSDQELLTHSGAGDMAAFDALYARYRQQAHRVAWSVCRDPGGAEDAVQEAFLSIWRSSATYNAQRGTVSAWLLTVVRYRAIDVLRRYANAAKHESDDACLEARPGAHAVEREVIQEDEHRRLEILLGRLPEPQGAVIRLAFHGQLSHAEIAAHLGLPAGTVKGRIRLGMEKLHASLSAAERASDPAGIG